jgi:hypothetical protein
MSRPRTSTKEYRIMARKRLREQGRKRARLMGNLWRHAHLSGKKGKKRAAALAVIEQKYARYGL